MSEAPRHTVGEPYPTAPIASPPVAPAPAVANATSAVEPTTQERVEPTTQELEEQHASFVEERQLVQEFAKKVIECFNEQCIAVVLLPWMGDGGTPPAGVLCPPSNTALLNEAQLQAAVQGKSVVVCPCTFKFPAEESAATRIIEQLLNMHDMCILAAHLLTPEVENTREWSQYVNDKMRRITETHVDDVLFDPDPEPTQLRLRIKMAKHSWEMNRQHLQQIMQQEPQAPTPEEIQALEAQHRQLLWEDIPRELMPHFGVLDPHLHEIENEEVGDFKLISKMVCNCGAVWEARNKHGEKVAIKCIDKKTISTPGEVEGINREYRFLQSFLRHPNIVRALDFLHSQTFVYLILEHVGDENLKQHVSKLPGQHMVADQSIGIFKQVVSALAYCHEKEITHRSVALNHVVLSKSEDGGLIPYLVDFHNAMVAKSGVQSRSVCGTFPCIAPEVLSGESYIPITADIWSIGILLLEIAGGLDTLKKVVPDVPEEPPDQWTEEQQQATSTNIKNYFLVDGSHERALAHKNGVQNEEVLGHLQSLLVLRAARPRLASLFPSPEEAPETNGLEHANDVVVTDVDAGDVGDAAA